jgi:hypothetical protein
MVVRVALAFSAILLMTAPGAAQDCPIKDFNHEAREDLLRKAPTCDKSMELFGACAYGAGGDVSLGQIVTEKCEGDFMRKLNKVERQAYNGEIKACSREYAKEDGTMYRAMEAGCRAHVAQTYARKFRGAPKRN